MRNFMQNCICLFYVICAAFLLLAIPVLSLFPEQCSVDIFYTYRMCQTTICAERNSLSVNAKQIVRIVRSLFTWGHEKTKNARNGEARRKQIKEMEKYRSESLIVLLAFVCVCARSSDKFPFPPLRCALFSSAHCLRFLLMRWFCCCLWTYFLF